MYSKSSQWGEVDEEGRLILPERIAEQYGLRAGARFRLESDGNRVQIHRPVTHLTKVYIEPTERCNLNCVTCIRNSWNEDLGQMSQGTFERILESLRRIEQVPTLFFGGLGEPLAHKSTIQWISQAKDLGARIELITNGTLLTEQLSRLLIDTDVDILWVSIDGATPESYADVRLGGELSRVFENLARFQRMRGGGHFPRPELGIAFVAMARNIHELPEVMHLGRRLGAKYFSVSNVHPYTAELQQEALYKRTFRNVTFIDSPAHKLLNLPPMDLDDRTRDAFLRALQGGYNVKFSGNNLGATFDVCKFIESGTLSIAWDGGVSPCWPLMHDHRSYLHGKPHFVRRHVVGNVNDRDLHEIWFDEEYVAYRRKVQNFEFAPCTACGGCELSEANEEDCFGNQFPACGSCLWSQGVIQCP